jgi:flagellin
MQINHNIRAMVTQHSLYSNNNAMSKSLEKLSTGLKINRAQDDSAGLAMSEQMRTQIRGLGKAKQNSQDSIAALQIAEGGLQEITNLMQRQRELAIQAANDTLTSTERKYLNDEFQELTQEIGRIAKTTDYNGKNMLNWSDDPNKSFGALLSATDIENAFKGELKSLVTLTGGLTTSNATSAASAINGLNISATVNTNIDSAINTIKGLTAVNKKDEEILSNLVERLERLKGSRALDGYQDAYKEAEKVVGNSAASYTLHIGANYSFGIGGKWGNEMTVTYISLSPGSLGLLGKSISMQNAATDAIDQLDKVIKSVSGVRAKLGTFINRLEYTINNIANLEFNTQDAESRIRDTDFAKETTNFTRNQIMVQSATSMLAQANSLPQSVLGLIG